MPRTSRNADRILAQLRASEKALTAYELLDQLRDEGVTAPPTVYRALTRLIERGDAHRVESLNAFAACRHDHCSSPVLAICDQCRRVIELEPEDLLADIDLGTAAVGFAVRHAVVELRGTCAECRAAGRDPAP